MEKIALFLSDKIELNHKVLICSITKEKLEENLIIDKNNTLYNLGNTGNFGTKFLQMFMRLIYNIKTQKKINI